MSENRVPDPGKEALAVPGVDVKIYLPKDPEKDHGKLLGFASVNLGGVFAVNNIRIYDSEKGPFVTMPGKRDRTANITTSAAPPQRRCGRPFTALSWAHTKKRWSRSVLPCAVR